MDLPLQAGDPFNRFVMQATADTITRRLKDRGYPSARVFTSFETNKDAETATVTLDADAGEERGHRHGRRDRRQPDRAAAGAQPARARARGGRYSQDELFQSQRNLYSSDLFRFATVNIDSRRVQPGGRLGAARWCR